MRLVLAAMICGVLAGCSTPGPAFRGLPAVRMHQGGSVFDIRVRDSRAEAIRVNPRAAMRLSSVGVDAVQAIETVSGCRVDRLTGDQAQMVAYLDCGAGAPSPPRRAPSFDCEIDLYDDESGTIYCDPERPGHWPRVQPGYSSGIQGNRSSA